MKSLPDLFRREGSSLSSSRHPFRELMNIQRQMERVFDDLWENGRFAYYPTTTDTELASYAPDVDVQETENHYLVSFDLPGMKKEDIKISLSGDMLTVSGERSSESESKTGALYRTERRYGRFERSFQLAGAAKPEQIEAQYADGVLKIAVPKVETARTHTIKIEDARPGFWEKFLGHRKEETRAKALSQPPGEKTSSTGKVA